MTSIFQTAIQANQALQNQQAQSLVNQARQQGLLVQAARNPLQMQLLQSQVDAIPIQQQLQQLELEALQQRQQQVPVQQQQQRVLQIGNLAEQALTIPDPNIRETFMFGAAQKLGLDVDPSQITEENLNEFVAAKNALTSGAVSEREKFELQKNRLESQKDPGITEFQRRNLELQEERLGLERDRLSQADDRLQLQSDKLESTINTALQEALSRSKARGSGIGKSEATKIVGSDRAIDIANDTVGVIDELIKHPGLRGATGIEGAINPSNYIFGTPEYDFALKLEQLQGKAFLNAFETLKGGGQITQIEGEKATAAIEQLSRRQSTEQFLDALQGLRETALRGRFNAEKTLSKQETKEFKETKNEEDNQGKQKIGRFIIEVQN